MLEAKHQSAL